MPKLKLPPKKWKNDLEKLLTQIIKQTPKPFSTITPSKIPKKAGVYIISEKNIPLYIGRTKNLKQRIYNNHLMGPTSNARLKKYLIEDNTVKNVGEAKKYIRERCSVRWTYESNYRKRGAIEGYFTAMLFPKYGIYEEH